MQHLPADAISNLVPHASSTRPAGNTGIRMQVLRRQPDGSWLWIIGRPEVPQP
jgi:hypothetical protein